MKIGAACALKDYIIYELHVGCFTAGGNFRRAQFLSRLFAPKLGVTAIELMPSHNFPVAGTGVTTVSIHFAVQNSYGGPEGLKKLVDACHRRGLAVILDVVYNHLGPEGNYFREFWPLFHRPLSNAVGCRRSISTGRGVTRCAIFLFRTRFIGSSDSMSMRSGSTPCTRFSTIRRSLFSKNWAMAVHREAKRLNREVFLIAESADNDARLVRARGARRLRPGCSVERRFPSLPAHAPYRRAHAVTTETTANSRNSLKLIAKDSSIPASIPNFAGAATAARRATSRRRPFCRLRAESRSGRQPHAAVIG